MDPRPQATRAKPLSKEELRASLDRVVEERDELREAADEAFMDGARCARENAVEIASKGLTPSYLEAAGFKVVKR